MTNRTLSDERRAACKRGGGGPGQACVGSQRTNLWRHLAAVKAVLEKGKLVLKEKPPPPESLSPKERRRQRKAEQTLRRKVRRALQTFQVTKIDRRRTLTQQRLVPPETAKGMPAEAVFLQLHQGRGRKE